MLTYSYTAYRKDTEQVMTADVQAENEHAAAKLLMDQGMFPISIEIKNRSGLASKLGVADHVGAKDRIIFTRQLSTLINAGLPLTQSLRTVEEQIQNKSLREIIEQVVADVEGGQTLSQAFSKYPKVFGEVYISLVAAGETSGSLDKALERIANQQEKDAAIISKIRGAVIYPVIVLIVIVLVLIFMLTSVLPQIKGLYVDLGQKLPLLTLWLVAISDFAVHYWLFTIILLVGVVLAVRNYVASEQGRSVWDGAKLNIPILGRIYRKVYMARFARTLSTLLESGIPMLEALRSVRNAIGNVHIEAALDSAISGVKGGKALSSTLMDQPTFMKLVPQMIKIGEESGAIDSMLERVAKYFESEVDDEVAGLSTTIEPALMVVLGVMVALIIASILLPVYSLVGSGAVSNLQ